MRNFSKKLQHFLDNKNCNIIQFLQESERIGYKHGPLGSVSGQETIAHYF